MYTFRSPIQYLSLKSFILAPIIEYELLPMFVGGCFFSTAKYRNVTACGNGCTIIVWDDSSAQITPPYGHNYTKELTL